MIGFFSPGKDYGRQTPCSSPSERHTVYSGVELLQESVERFLKAYLISKGWKLEKIHNLSTLLDRAVAFDEHFKTHADLCENLTVQFWAQHYPGDDLSEVGFDYVELREHAGKLVAAIERETKGAQP